MLRISAGELYVQGSEEWRLKRLEEYCERHEKDLYRGNGLPGITTRMANVENSLEAFDKILHEMKRAKDTKQNLILGGIVTLAVGLLLAHLKLI